MEKKSGKLRKLSGQKVSRAFSYSLNYKIEEEYYLNTTNIIGFKVLSLQRSHQYSRGI